MSNQEPSWILSLEEKFGLAENGMRLIIGMLFVYPVFLIYNMSRLRRCPAEIQHVYFILTGMCISYWTLGAPCIVHGLTCILVNYFVLKVFGGSLYVTGALFCISIWLFMRWLYCDRN
jgi:hypothetical protein